MPGDRSYVRYHEGIETVAAGEAETIAGIIRSMTQESQTVAARDGHTVRASHAKSTGVLKGELEVLPALPEPLAQGLFAAPARFPVLIRLAQGPGEVLSDSVSTHRGMAIKVFGVQGPKLGGHAADTQDFVLATGPVFAQASAATFLVAIKGLEKGTPMPEGVKQAVSTASRAMNAAVQAVSGSESPTLGFFGHSKRSPLADAYFSQAALRYGDYVAKIGVFPVSPDLVAEIDRTLDTGADPDAFRTAVTQHFRTRGAVFELRVKLCTDPDAMPVEDASVPWSETDSPYRAVARITVPAQDAYSPARHTFVDERISFQPANALLAHRPLGSLMRARLATYEVLSRYRQERNGRARLEPGGLEVVPD